MKFCPREERLAWFFLIASLYPPAFIVAFILFVVGEVLFLDADAYERLYPTLNTLTAIAARGLVASQVFCGICLIAGCITTRCRTLRRRQWWIGGGILLFFWLIVLAIFILLPRRPGG